MDEFLRHEYNGVFNEYTKRMGGSSTLAQDCEVFGVPIVAAILVKTLETYLERLS